MKTNHESLNETMLEQNEQVTFKNILQEDESVSEDSYDDQKVTYLVTNLFKLSKTMKGLNNERHRRTALKVPNLLDLISKALPWRTKKTPTGDAERSTKWKLLCQYPSINLFLCVMKMSRSLRKPFKVKMRYHGKLPCAQRVKQSNTCDAGI